MEINRSDSGKTISVSNGTPEFVHNHEVHDIDKNRIAKLEKSFFELTTIFNRYKNESSELKNKMNEHLDLTRDWDCAWHYDNGAVLVY